MWLKLFFLLLYFLVLFVLARFFEAIVWYETGIFATQLVDPVALSFKKLKTILECRGLGYSGLPEKKDVRELVEKSGDLMEGELYSALKEEEASESVSSTNFSGEMHFYELVEDTKDGIWLVQLKEGCICSLLPVPHDKEFKVTRIEVTVKSTISFKVVKSFGQYLLKYYANIVPVWLKALIAAFEFIFAPRQ
uniref:E3 ubiquitin-protein ligase RNF103 isoform X4 n=1 Tax=Castor canadensis TaxID=51338 RepID=A0A8B7VQR1_CASCN|nr:E3 ubiquitin-protein ligase RNF103 isoform X4 [Castor canadensis]